MPILLICICACFLYLLLYLANKSFKKTNYYKDKKEFENRIEGFDAVPTNLQIVSMGSTYARFAYTFVNTSKRGFNFAQSPQSLSYDFRILQQYAENLEEGCIVIITAPVFIFAFTEYTGIKYRKFNYKYYTFMDKKYINAYNPFIKFLYTRFPILLAGFRAGHIFKDTVRKNIVAMQCSNLNEKEISHNAADHLAEWKNQFGLSDFKKAFVPQDIRENMETVVTQLQTMLSFCKEKGWRPVIVSPPFCDKMNAAFSDEFAEEYLYRNIKKANTLGVPYFDYRQHPDFQKRYDFFFNGCDWLAEEGREHFMELLFQDMQKEGLL